MKVTFMKQTLKKYSHAWVLLYFAIYLPWFFWLESTVTRDFHIIHARLDDMIPFVEYFIIPYIAWFFYVGGVVLYFFLKDKRDFYRVCTYLFLGMTISLMICTVFHNGTDLRPYVDPHKNICCWLVSLLHAVDTSTNVFPSIHVFNSVAVHVAIVKSESLRNHPHLRRASLVLCILICLSTMFLKQHSVVDVSGALVLAYILYPIAYSRIDTVHEGRFARRFRTRKALG